MKTWLWILFVGCLAGISPAQRLRDGVAAADRVVVGKQVSAQPWGEHLMLHELEVLKTLKGEPADRLVIVEITSISGHAHPAPGETRLYCLHDYTRSAQKAGLPEHGGPFFKMSGYQGSNPTLVENLDDDPHIALARIVLDAEVGVSTQQTAFALAELALEGAPSVRSKNISMPLTVWTSQSSRR